MDYLEIIKSVGFPAACLIFMGLSIWRILVWTGVNVVLPIKESHVKLVESAQKTNEVNSETLDKMSQILQANEARDKATYTLVVETHEIVKGFKAKI